MRISQYYGLQGQVPFVDVDVVNDSRLFVDPCAVRMFAGHVKQGALAVACLDTFFAELRESKLESPRAEELLGSFREPWETRMGLSVAGSYGRGGATDTGLKILNELRANSDAYFELAIMKRLEHLPLFIEGVADDITSDITTRIIFDALVDFTNEMMLLYPQLARETKRVVKQVWNPDSRDWEEKEVVLPVAGGKELLLVPREWAQANILMSHTRYSDKVVLDFYQEKRTVLDINGHAHKPRKEDLRRDKTLELGCRKNLEVTLRRLGEGREVVAEFEAFVDEQYDSTKRMQLQDEHLER